MTRRLQILAAVTGEPRTLSAIARDLGLTRRDVEEDLPHLLRSARTAGDRIEVVPARCRACGFTFGEDKLSKPGRCPSCRSTWMHEPMLVRR